MADDHAEALAAFEHAAEELPVLQDAAVSVANYALLAQAATVTAPELLHGTAAEFCARGASAAIALLTAVAGVWLVGSLNRAIDKERTRMREAHKLLPTLWAIHEPLHASARADASIVLRAAIALGAVAAVAVNVVKMLPL